MPRAVDLRQPEATHDPTRDGTEFHLVGFQDYAAIFADIIAQFTENITQGIIDLIKDLTGIDLSLFAELFGDLDFTNPLAFFESLLSALFGLGESFLAGIFGLTGWDLTGVLPDFKAPQLLHDIIDAIVNAFRLIPIVGPGIADLVETILAMVGFSSDAQQTGTDNSGEISKIKAGLSAAGASGTSIISDFDGPVATSLTGYTQIYSGAGGGTEGINGAGYAHWAVYGGASPRTVVNLHNTPLTTKTQYASMVLKTAVGGVYGFGTYANRTLVVRSDSTAANCIKLTVLPTSAALTAVVAGTSHTLHTASVTTKPGDFWELFPGTAADDHAYTVKLNGSSFGAVTDVSSYAVLTNFRVGFGGTAGVNVAAVPGGYAQYAPPDVGAFSAADRTG